MTDEEVKNLTHDKMLTELCKIKAVKEIRDCKTAVRITIDSLRNRVDTEVDIYNSPVFVELVSQLMLKATKDKDSGIGGDHIIMGALKFCIATTLKGMHEKEQTAKSETESN